MFAVAVPDPTWSSRTILTHDTRPLAAIYQMPDLIDDLTSRNQDGISSQCR